MVLEPHLGDYAMRNNNEIVRAVPEMRRTPIHLNHHPFGSAFEKNLISDAKRFFDVQRYAGEDI